MTTERLQFADLALAGVGNCTALRELILAVCSELESLPNSKCPACSLNARLCLVLQSEWLTACMLQSADLRLLAGIGGCTALWELNLFDCDALQSLPEGNP